jgi:hypothetical protein
LPCPMCERYFANSSGVSPSRPGRRVIVVSTVIPPF